MTGAGAELKQQLEYLATELLGWQREAFDAYDDPQDGGKFLRHIVRWWDRSHNPLGEEGLQVLLSGNGMLEIIEAMFKRGQHCMLESWPSRNFRVNYTCCFTDGIEDADPEGADHAPEAVARAAYEALTTKDQ